MPTLIDRVQKVGKEETAELLASLQTYRIPVYLQVVGNDLLWELKWLFQQLLVLFGGTCDPDPRDTMWARHETLSKQLLALPPNKLQIYMRELLYEKIDAAGGGGLKEVSDDALAAAVAKAAGKVFRQSAIRGLSVPELCDYVYQQYPNRKGPTPLFQLRCWLLGLVALPLSAACASLLFAGTPLLFWAILCLVLQIIWTLRTRRRIAQWQLARFLWLAISGTGETLAAKREEMPSARLPQPEQDGLAAKLKRVRTLLRTIALTKQECTDEKAAIHKAETAIEQTRRKIDELCRKAVYEESRSVASAARALSGKVQESRKLQNELDRHKETFRRKESYLARLEQSLDDLQPSLEERIKTIWTSHFSRISFEPQMLSQVVKGFEFEDLIRMEQRFSELQTSKAPFSLAENIQKTYVVRFRTAQGEMGSLFFFRGSKPNGMVFSKVTRTRALQETPAPAMEFRQQSGRMPGRSAEQLLEQLQQEKLRLEEQVEALRQKSENCIQQINDAYLQLLQRLKKLNLLYLQLDSKQGEFNRLDKSLVESQRLIGPRRRELEQARLRQEDAAKELDRYKETARALSREVETLFQKLDQAETEKAGLLKSLEEREKEIAEKKSGRQRQIQDAIQETSFQEQEYREKLAFLASQLATLNIFVKEAEKRVSGSDHQEAVAQLAQSVQQLTQDKEALQREAEHAKQVIAELKQQRESSKLLTDERGAQVEKLRLQLVERSCKILHDKDLIDRFQTLLQSAQRSIRLASPYVGWTSFQTVSDLLEAAVQKAPSLKIDFLCGIQDSDGPRNSVQLQRSVEAVDKLEKRLRKSLSLKVGNPCVKLLICDKSSFLLGNASLLPSGENAQEEDGLHHEVAILSNDPATLKELADMYFDF